MNTQEIIARAQARGSTATTLKGAARWLVKHPAKVNPAPLPGSGRYYPIENKRGPWRNPRLQIDSLEKAIRRGLKDKPFRRRLIVDLKREAVGLCLVQWDLEWIRSAAGKLSSANAQFANIKKYLARLGSTLPEHMAPFDPKREQRLSLVHFLTKTARKAGARINMTGADARVLPSYGPSHLYHKAPVTTWKGGRPISYDRAVYNNHVTSFALRDDTDLRTVRFMFHTTTYTVTLPDGYTWARDSFGLKALYRYGDDYHPAAEDLMRPDAAAHIVSQIQRLRDKRRDLALEQAAEAAASEGVWVCMADALRAGNCLPGTQSFVRQKNLDERRHYTPTELLALAGDSMPRVRLTIKAATIRHRQEMERGYAMLAEHKV